MTDKAAVAQEEKLPKKRRGRVLPGRREGFGRAKGTPNKVTKLAKTIAQDITLGNEKVVARLKKEAESGAIEPSVFNKLLEYGYGKPKQVVEIESPVGNILPLEEFAKSLSPQEFNLLLELSRRRRTTVIDVTPQPKAIGG